jgi:hypothetical protein
MGTNSAIFKAQLATFPSYLGPEHRFVLIDGTFERESANGVAKDEAEAEQ